ncbi:hypothetical protein V5799_034138 [Amblyomma americanum]|uniref:Fibronectin type-III domain-containing protein n=1 Tax=Amblyomma americanum TaxID=6943 RepID=A0AAQ4DLB1_AMBAM
MIDRVLTSEPHTSRSSVFFFTPANFVNIFPAPPTNLTVAVSCDGNVDATWLYKAQGDIDGFITQLCYKNGSGCRNKTVNASFRKVTYVVTEPNTTFTISVRAYVDDGSTSDADQVTFTSFPNPPNLEDLAVNAISPTEVQATWSEKWSHDIEFAICSEPTQCKTQKVPGLLLNYTFTDLEPDTKYTVSAQAEFSAQNKTCKGDKQERVASTFELDPPRNLTVDVLCTNEANVKWMYDNKKWLTGFVARLCYESDPQICKNKTIPYTELHCTFPLPDFNAKYNVTVWAYYKDHESKKKSFSEPAGTNFTSYPKLPRLGDLTVTGVSTTELLVAWQDKWPGDIYFTLCSSPAECRNETAEGTEHKRTFDGLHPNTTYTVSVKTGATLSNRTCFGPVQEATASTFVKPPGKVQNLKGDIINGTLLEASWDAPEEDEQPSGYTVQCYDSETHYNESEDIIGSKKSNQVSFTLHELRATFNCSVRAFNTNTTGRYVYGPPESFDVTTDGIDAPKDVTLVASTATSFTFRWLADPNATKCEVEVRREDLYGESLVRIEACGESVNGTVTHNVTDLDPWTAYNVSMKNCRDTFCGEPSFAVSTTEVAAPSEVRNFSYAIEKDVKVHFTWEAPEHPNGPLDGYCLRIYDEDKHETRMIVFAAIVTNITVDLKFEFHLFNVSIAAYNIDNTTKAPLYSSESELGFETFGKGPMPPRPKAEDVEENRVQLYWEEPEDPRFNITGFEVKVTGQTPFETTARNVTIEHLSAWTNYEVNVSSCTNKSDCGQDRHFAFRTDFGEPSEPQDFKAPSAGTHWMLVQWEKPKVLNGPLSGYNLTFSQGASRTHALTTELSYNATNLVPGTNYEVSVYAFNEVQSVIKHGPAVTLQASTQADNSKCHQKLELVWKAVRLKQIVAPLKQIVSATRNSNLFGRWPHSSRYSLNCRCFDGNDRLGRAHPAHLSTPYRCLLPVQEVPEEDGASVVHETDGKEIQIYGRNTYNSSNEPLRIFGLKAIVRGGNRATVQWENATGPLTGYEITVCLVNERPRCESAVGLMTSKKLQHLTPGATYEVQVLAFLEAHGNRTNGKTEKIHFRTAQVPAVEQLKVISVESTSIELSWAPAGNSSVSHFDIDACPTDGGACVHVYTDDWSHLIRGLTPETTYNIHVRSVTEEEKELSFGPASNVSATTMQLLPRLDGFEVEAVSLREVRATWKVPIDVDVRLHVCPLESPRKSCVNYVTHGTRLAYTISGLSPSTKYSIEASGAVTLGANTCLGFGITREITTLTEAVCRYDEDFKEVVRELSDTVRALSQRQNTVERSEESDAIHSKCKAIEEKLRILSEDDLADCLQDIDKLLENYPRKATQ